MKPWTAYGMRLRNLPEDGQMKKTLMSLAAISVLAVALGCSGSPPPEAAPGEASMPAAGAGIALEIRNDFASTVDCAIEAPGRPRKLLGTVLSNSSETYIVDTSQIAIGFRVMCSRQAGQTVRSDPINTISRAKIRYTLSTGLVNVTSLP